jgi:hypothetical protein
LNDASATPKPVMVWTSANSVDISGLSQNCINNLNAFNAQPVAVTLNDVHGATDIVNGTAVSVTNMSQSVTAWMHQQDAALQN